MGDQEDQKTIKRKNKFNIASLVKGPLNIVGTLSLWAGLMLAANGINLHLLAQNSNDEAKADKNLTASAAPIAVGVGVKFYERRRDKKLAAQSLKD